MVEAWVEADLLEEVREVTDVAFGDSPEHRLLRVLANAKEALPLYEISVRSIASRRAVLGSGRLRLVLERMEKAGLLNNVGTLQRPRYQLNPKDDKARLLASLFVDGNSMTAPSAFGQSRVS